MPATILPDSRIEIVNRSSIPRTLKLEIDFTKLSEGDKKAFSDYLLQEADNYSHLDLSGCHLVGCLPWFLPLALTALQEKGGYTFRLLPDIEDLNKLTFEETQMLGKETELNGGPRKELFEVLMQAAFLRGKESLDVIASVRQHRLFHNRAIDGETLGSCLARFDEDPSPAFIWAKNFIASSRAADIFPDIIVLCDKRMKTGRPFENVRAAARLLQYALFFEFFFPNLLKGTKEEIEKQTTLYKKLFTEIFSLRDEDQHAMLFKLPYNMMKSQPSVLLSFLSQAKRRRFPIAMALSALYPAIDSSEAREALALFSDDLYEEAVYHRTASEALCMLAQDTDISRKNKQKLIKICHDQLIKKNKDAHYAVWSLMITLIKNSSVDLNTILEKITGEMVVSLEKIYWDIFSAVLNISAENHYLYLRNFKPDQNPQHHLLFAMHQSFRGEKDIQLMVEELIKALLFWGMQGYRSLRYGSRSPHLEAVFHGPYGALLKTLWLRNEEAREVGEEGCRVYMTDNPWDLLTWGIGFNCLDPLDASFKQVSHLLNGEHQLVLLRDKNDRVLAGYIVHLLFQNSGHPTPQPVLAVGRTYIREELGLKKQEIQAALDQVVIRKFEPACLPFVAFNLRCQVSSIPRDSAFSLRISSRPLPLFLKRGLTGLIGSGEGDGMDHDFIEIGEKTEDHIKFKDYQTIYASPVSSLSRTAILFQHLYADWALERQKQDSGWMHDFNKTLLLSRGPAAAPGAISREKAVKSLRPLNFS